MASDRDTLPPLPPRPKPRAGEPAKPISLSSRAATPRHGEGFSVRDLAEQTRGPIGSKRDVERQISQDVEGRFTQDQALRRRRARVWERPYTLKGRSMSGGKR